jgi:hypothetical protein
MSKKNGYGYATFDLRKHRTGGPALSVLWGSVVGGRNCHGLWPVELSRSIIEVTPRRQMKRWRDELRSVMHRLC